MSTRQVMKIIASNRIGESKKSLTLQSDITKIYTTVPYMEISKVMKSSFKGIHHVFVQVC